MVNFNFKHITSDLERSVLIQYPVKVMYSKRYCAEVECINKTSLSLKPEGSIVAYSYILHLSSGPKIQKDKRFKAVVETSSVRRAVKNIISTYKTSIKQNGNTMSTNLKETSTWTRAVRLLPSIWLPLCCICSKAFTIVARAQLAGATTPSGSVDGTRSMAVPFLIKTCVA